MQSSSGIYIKDISRVGVMMCLCSSIVTIEPSSIFIKPFETHIPRLAIFVNQNTILYCYLLPNRPPKPVSGCFQYAGFRVINAFSSQISINNDNLVIYHSIQDNRRRSCATDWSENQLRYSILVYIMYSIMDSKILCAGRRGSLETIGITSNFRLGNFRFRPVLL